ncbi:MAG: IPTL-CTERM sorting domain-containing protein, partial [Betaproteobacteria bacterium]
ANISESSPGIITYLKLIDAPVTSADISALQNEACSTVVTPTYAIAVSTNPPAGGTAACAPNPVLSGGSSVCTAAPNAGYSFVSWAGDCSGAMCNLTGVTAAKSVTANFAPVSGQPPAQQIPTLSKMGTWLLAGLLALLTGIWLRRRTRIRERPVPSSSRVN